LINKPEVPSKIDVYMGWRIKWYGPSVINIAPAEGSGKILNLLFCIVAIAHTTKRPDNEMKIAGTSQSSFSRDRMSNSNIKINWRVTSSIDLIRSGILNVSIKLKQPGYYQQAIIVNTGM
jgi:hypothetical protein